MRKTFVALKGLELHPDLLQFLPISTEKRLQKIKSEIYSQPIEIVNNEAVYVTINEETD